MQQELGELRKVRTERLSLCYTGGGVGYVLCFGGMDLNVVTVVSVVFLCVCGFKLRK